MQAGREMVPDQHFVFVAVAMHVVVGGKPRPRQGIEPAAQLEVFCPLLEGAALAPDLLDDRTQTPIAAGHQALNEGGLGVVPAQLHAFGAPGVLAQQVDLAFQLRHRVLAEPLERGERLGHEPAHRDGDGRPPLVTLTDGDAVAGQLSDAEGILVGFSGEPDEEVELDPPPAVGEGSFDGGVEVLLADQLVDDLAHAPRTRFGGEGQPGTAGLLQLGGDGHGEGVNPQGR